MNSDKHHHRLSLGRNAAFVPCELWQKCYYKPRIFFTADAEGKKPELLQGLADVEGEKHPKSGNPRQEELSSGQKEGKGKPVPTSPSGVSFKLGKV